MTIEYTEIRIDWLEGISVETSEVLPGSRIDLERIESADRDGQSVYKSFEVKSPDELTFDLWGQKEGEIQLGSLIRYQINEAELKKEETLESGAPKRGVRITHLYTWKR